MPCPHSDPKNVKQNQAVLPKAKLVCGVSPWPPPWKLSAYVTGNVKYIKPGFQKSRLSLVSAYNQAFLCKPDLRKLNLSLSSI